LDRLGQRISERVARDGELPPALGPEAAPLERTGLEFVREVLGTAAVVSEPRLVHVGLAQVLLEPEFADSQQVAGVLELLERGRGVDVLIQRLADGDVEILLGGEPPLEQVPHTGFVLAPFGHPQRPEGFLGVVGTQRLPYERAVPAVRYVARLMTRLYAGEAL
jgi:heat-inducible transcriptional repressor